ncbi:hypothetical protein [Rhodococcus koreensis]
MSTDPRWMVEHASHAEDGDVESIDVVEPTVAASSATSTDPSDMSGRMDLADHNAGRTTRIGLATSEYVRRHHRPDTLTP